MTQKFHELLLSELHMVSYEPGNPEELTDERLCSAMTVNENLRSLGFVLRPEDLVRLAVSPSLFNFFDGVEALVPSVTAEPMYPGFPQQVMEMSEAEFRLHQLIHYFSTYGLETLLGQQVRKGWLPEAGETKRRGKDASLLECRVLDLVPEAEAPLKVLTVLLERRERLTDPELELVTESVSLCRAEQMRGLTVRFKENLSLVFPCFMAAEDRETALQALQAVCAHPGDVFRCAKEYLTLRKYHLATREKKRLVRLLETYPVPSFRENLIPSNHLRERNLLVLQHLDYNRFSVSPAHREAVRALRSGELLSWHGIGESLLKSRDPKALAHWAQRPGYMLRMLNRLLSLGYTKEEILNVLLPQAGKISGHLLLKTVRTLTKRHAVMDQEYEKRIAACRQKYRREELGVPRLNREEVSCSAEWKRIDVCRRWLTYPREEARQTAFALLENLTRELNQLRKTLADKQALLARIEHPARREKQIRLLQNACVHFDESVLELLKYRNNPEKLREEIRLLASEISEQEMRISFEREAAERTYAERLAVIKSQNVPACEAELKSVDIWEQTELKKAEAEHALALARYQEAMKTLPGRLAAELEALAEIHRAEILKSGFDDQSTEIVKALLKEHFIHAETPLRGKKVFLDLELFDLDHSELETEDRSADGGYIRSGICYRIPPEAKFVRFFVYWNDRSRVDLDLHASGTTVSGENLRVGWNADFRNSGVVHSGDITHSDAAEYIDIDLSAPVREIRTDIHLFSGKRAFKAVQTCYVGLMAVSGARQDVKHYDPKNCFFTHRLTQNSTWISYGIIDVQRRFVRFVGQADRESQLYASAPSGAGPLFSLKDYLDCLFSAQEVQIVSEREEADLLLTMGKSTEKQGLSLVDHNFFLEC